MALTIDTELHPQVPSIAIGQLKAKLVSVTFDSSYALGGESFTPALVGMSEFVLVMPFVDANADLPYAVHYDYTAQTLMVYGVEQDADAATTEPFDEENSAANLAALVVRVLCLGF